MAVYLDTSVVVPIFVIDAFVSRARGFLATSPDIVLSDFVAAEFASVVAIRVRENVLTATEAHSAFHAFDTWRGTTLISIATADVEQAARLIRRLDMPIRAPDAINLAAAWRLGAELATFDRKMSDAARKIGLAVAKV